MDNENPKIEDLSGRRSLRTQSKRSIELQQELFRDQTQPAFRRFSPEVRKTHQGNTVDSNKLFAEFLRQIIRDSDRRSSDVSRKMLQQQTDIFKTLTLKRVEKFEHFYADESLVGEQCMVCLNDLKKGTKMVRLDCNDDHYLCKMCADSWFEDHNTCPICRHTFNY